MTGELLVCQRNHYGLKVGDRALVVDWMNTSTRAEHYSAFPESHLEAEQLRSECGQDGIVTSVAGVGVVVEIEIEPKRQGFDHAIVRMD